MSKQLEMDDVAAGQLVTVLSNARIEYPPSIFDFEAIMTTTENPMGIGRAYIVRAIDLPYVLLRSSESGFGGKPYEWRIDLRRTKIARLARNMLTVREQEQFGEKCNAD